MSFAVAADAYDRFMGRYSVPLALEFAEFAKVDAGQKVLDVGCGPGALTSELARRLGPSAVVAVDPSATFVTAAQDRHPGIVVRQASAERLPFDDGAFDAALAQLVVHFMADPIVGLGEMGRVTRQHGTVAACVWDHASGSGPLAPFWDAVHQQEPTAGDESALAGARQGHLGQLFHEAGLGEVEEGTISVSVEHPSFDEWWEPFTLGVGPAGAYVHALDADRLTELRDLCRRSLPETPFVVTARAWAAHGVA
jgi:SAM-dependent methyltransferase